MRGNQKYPHPQPGDIFNSWTVKREIGPTPKGQERRYECRCVCGNISAVKKNALIKGTSTQCKSCASSKPKANDYELYGKIFDDWTVLNKVRRRRGRIQYLCKCRCGNEKFVIKNHLLTGISKRCKACVYDRKKKDFVGRKFGVWKVTKHLGVNNYNKPVWLCECEQGHTSERMSESLLKHPNEKCKECLSVGEIIGPHWKCHIKKQALSRGIPFKITMREAWELFVEQGGKCALTGVVIKLPETINGKKTASLDRINSNEGYSKSNCQWVHKTANKLKHELSQEDFISLCHNVANIHKDPKSKWEEKECYSGRNTKKKYSPETKEEINNNES